MQAVLTGTHMHCSSHTVHGHAECGKHFGKGFSTATPASFRQAAELYKSIIAALLAALPVRCGTVAVSDDYVELQYLDMQVSHICLQEQPAGCVRSSCCE